MTALRKWLDDERGRGISLAKELDVTPGAVTQWADIQVPAERVFAISSYTGIEIHKLRPDLVSKSQMSKLGG